MMLIGSAIADAAIPQKVRAQISALSHTVLSSEMSGKIVRLNLRTGESFKKGARLVSFDCRAERAKMKKAQAIVAAAKEKHAVSLSLSQLNATSTLEVDVAAAKLTETQADVELMRVVLSKCDVRAPFAGRVVKRHAEPHQYITAGKPLLEILDPSRLTVEMIVPSHWLSRYTDGTRLTMTVDETGRDYPIQLIRFGSLIDAVTQTITVIAEFDEPHPALLPGMSGWVQFPQSP